ncbi:DNA-directed RNA polymerase subunit beta', partial [Bienertia sinuspersici]
YSEEQVVPARYRQEFLTIAWEQHNDANRALMSFNMQRQAVPLSQSEKCIIGTGLERQVALDSGLWEKSISSLYAVEGYNFEDAVLISERLVYENIFTSFHIRKYEIQTYVTSQGPEKVTREIPHLEAHLLRNLDKNGIVRLGSCYNPERIHVYISQKREIKVGDKVAGRHGNKGIISRILPRQDMPYLQDGRPVDMIFNPLGVPSRMNVGQIFECSLGLAGSLLDRHYRIAPFDERYEQEASRKLVFSELYEASKQTANPWVFEPEYPGKSRIFDGRTGDPFEQPVIIGNPYILKLIHQVDDKIHGRSSGHYALVTQQPLRGRAKQGGQRVGEMEVWALEGFGVAHILQEMLTYKSDHIKARQEVLGTTIIGGTIPNPENAPESFRLLKTQNFVNNAESNLLILEYEGSYPNFSFARPIAKKPTFLRLQGLFEYEIQSWKYSIPLFFTTQGFDTFRNREIATGAGTIREQLADLDLRTIIDYSFAEWKELGEEGSTGNEWEDRKVGRRKDLLVRRMELAKHFIRTNIEPEWMVLCLLPVLPPELRPIIQIDGGKLMSSDINELYRRVIYRNNTLTDLLSTSRSTPGELVMCQEKLVQEAVDTLLDNGIRGQPMRDGHNKVYKSFSDVIEGKEGRFRETLLGKRVDYSGRSVIVVGPSLSLHRCGLPREIAIELFQTFVIRGLIRQHLASNIGVAKRKIREKEPIVWKILQEVMQGHPVLLNRAPTLHRLGIQAFQPILVEGRAICLHPLVCKGFNADFDGDQMAVHVPLSLEAQAEARLLMFSHMNLLSPAIGDPISVPTQDMLIGLYILTSGNRRGICANRYNPWNHKTYQNKRIDHNNYKYMKEFFFCNSYDAIGAYRQKRINLDSPLWLRWQLDQRIIASREVPIEVHYESLGTYHEIYAHYLIIRSVKKEILFIYIRTTVGHISLYREIEEAIQGFCQACS